MILPPPLTYIFPASSSRAHSEETSQLPDVKKRGGTVGSAGCIRDRSRAERESEEYGIKFEINNPPRVFKMKASR